ncbi:putative reverse transcriptase domain-containing protein [Tanacetum coccineum]
MNYRLNIQAFWFHTLNPTIEPSYTPPVIVDVPGELPKVSLVNASLKKLKFHLTQFNSVVKKRTTPSALEEGSEIMAASAIAISFDSSDESVGSPPSRVILFGDIPTVIPSTSVVAPETSTIAPVISSAAPVVETTLVASPTGLCGLVPYLDSDSDSPDEMSKVASHPSSSSEFPISPVTTPPGIHRRSAILIRPGEAIPFGRPYRTHLNGPRKLLTARKRVGPLPARRLAWRRASPRSSDHRPSSSSSSSDSSPVHSSDLDAPDQAHSRSSTRDVPPRLCYPPRRAPRCSEAFRRWCAAPLSTLYPPTTLESSSGDSSERPPHSSSHPAGPSRKRCRSPIDSVPSSTQDSYSSEASIEEDTEINPIETEVDMELGIGDRDDVRDHVEIDPRDVKDDTEEYEADTSTRDTVEVGIDLMSAPIVEEDIVEPAGEDSSNSSRTRDGIVKSFEDMPFDLDDAVRDFYHHMSEVRIDRIVRIETVQRRLEADQLIARGERAGMIKRIESLRFENLKVRVMLDIERDRVNSLRLHMSFSQEEFCQVHRDRDDTWGRLRRLESYVERHLDLGLGNGNDNRGGDGNGNDTRNGNNRGDNGDGNENRNGNGRGDRPGARECTYQDFMKCQPLSFKGTEGVAGLIRWSENINNCPEKYQVKYATCTLLNSALTWWNSHKRTIRTDAAYALSWRELLKMMTEVYCPRNEIQKMETELWNLSVKNNDMATYTQRFQELTIMYTKMVPEEEDRVEKFYWRNVENKRRLDNNYRDNHGQQPPHKRQNTRGQNVARAYTAGNNEKRGYEGTLPFCNRCRLHHEGQCTMKCNNCKKVGHMTRDCRAVIATTTQGTLGPNQRVITCFECGAQGHYRKDCPKVKNQNRGNKARVPDARGKAYVLGGGDANLGSNTVTGTFLLNDHHAYMLFDSGADRSFISNTFSTLLDIIPSALDVSYAVELADGKTSETSTMLRGYTLGLLRHPFNIDLMPIDLGSFDVIIGMDWLAKNHAVIVCDEKIVRIPYGNEILIVQGDKSDKEKKSTLSIISCVKAQKYMEKGCQLFLAQVTVKENKDESKEKRLEDTCRDWY